MLELQQEQKRSIKLLFFSKIKRKKKCEQNDLAFDRVYVCVVASFKIILKLSSIVVARNLHAPQLVRDPEKHANKQIYSKKTKEIYAR